MSRRGQALIKLPTKRPELVIVDLSDEALNRILDKVGSQYVPLVLRSASEDREVLRRKIEFVPTWLETARALGSKAHRGRRRQSLRKILQSARNLEKALAEELTWWEIICRLPLADSPRANVKRLIEIVSDIIAVPEPAGYLVDRFKSMSPREWLASERLVQIFDQHFKKTEYRKRKSEATGKPAPPGLSRSSKDGQVGGPCVRFIEAVMTELQIVFSPDSIARAMTRARSAKPPRRKPAITGQ